MSLPVVLPGSCCRLTGASLAPHVPDSSYRSRDRCMSTVPSRMPGAHSGLIPALLPGRPLLSLGLLQLVLGCSMVALSFGALSLSNSPPIRNSCPFWAGSSVILSGIIGLTTWKRPVLLLVNLFVLLSVVCILLNLAAFILCCQGAQLVSSSGFCQLSDHGNVCSCCSESPSSLCQEEKMLKIQASHSCGAMRILLKKVLFALCALNALTTAVCLIAAALRYLQIFSVRRPCMVEVQNVPEEGEEQTHISDPEEFVPPAPPPSYFSTIYSCTPRLARRMFGDSVIPLPHIYGARIKGVEVLCPLDPPPPYEAVAMETTAIPTQGPEGQGLHPSERFSHLSETDVGNDGRCAAPPTAGTVLGTTLPGTTITTTLGTTPGTTITTTLGTTPGLSSTTSPGTTITTALGTTPGLSSTTLPGTTITTTLGTTPGTTIATTLSTTPGPAITHSPSASPSTTPAMQLRVAGLTSRKAHRPQLRRSNSDPVLLDLEAKVMSCEAATQTELGPATGAGPGVRTGAGPASMPATVTLRRGRGPRRPRPSSMVDYQSYRETKLLVAQFLQQSSSCSLTPEVQELIDGITTVLRTDEEHMEDAVHCASLIDQVMSRGNGAAQTAQGKQPRRDCTSSTLPLRKRPGLIHLRSCGDLSTFTWAELQVSSRGSQPGGRPHSLIGVSRETVI